MSLADEMFQAVLNYPEGMYPYYIKQAREGLAQLTVDTTTSDTTALSSSYTAILVSSTSKK